MLKKHLLLLSLAVVLCNNQVVATDMMQEELPEGMMSDADVRSCKCKKFKCINVCGNAYIGGSETVTGSVTAASFITPAGVLFNGLRNYAVLSNQIALTSPATLLWGATPAANLSSGISFNNLSGNITLPTTGLFLVQYTVRLDIAEGTAETSLATVQVQQGSSTVTPIAITQPAVINNTTVITTAETGNVPQVQISGYAFLNSANGNIINLLVTFDNGYSVPAATGTDANAQMVILQVN